MLGARPYALPARRRLARLQRLACRPGGSACLPACLWLWRSTWWYLPIHCRAMAYSPVAGWGCLCARFRGARLHRQQVPGGTYLQHTRGLEASPAGASRRPPPARLHAKQGPVVQSPCRAAAESQSLVAHVRHAQLIPSKAPYNLCLVLLRIKCGCTASCHGAPHRRNAAPPHRRTAAPPHQVTECCLQRSAHTNPPPL